MSNEGLLTNESTMDTFLSKEEYDLQWNQQKQINRMRNIQSFTGYLPDGRYFHNGVRQN